MNQRIRAVGMKLAVLLLAAGALAQKQSETQKTAAPQKQTTSTREFGKSYETLRPEQKRLVDDYVARYNPPAPAEKKMEPAGRIRTALARPLKKIQKGPDLSKSMSSLQPVNELVRPDEHQNSNAFAIMAMPAQMADSFLCQERQTAKEPPQLKKEDAKYGGYYLSASQLNLGEEASPALLLLWGQEKERWRVLAWAVEVP